MSKALAIWRRAVSAAKAAAAQRALAGGGPVGGGGLFALCPVLQAPLAAVWGICCEVAATRLHAVKVGQVRV